MIRFFSSILIGLGLGYLAQRSRMCFVGGIRDYILVKDKALLRGFIAFFITTWLIYSVLFFSGILKPVIFSDSSGTNNNILTSSEYQCNSEISSGDKEIPKIIFNDLIKKIFIIPPKINLLSLVLLVAGFTVGILSVLANGCPMRQHILASQGNMDSVAYLFGFYIAVIIYDLFTSKLIYLIFNYI
jgi:hypothetical protein